MTATDELRRMLDELRKLACDINEEEIKSHSVITLNQGRYNRQFRLDMNHDWLNAWHAELERILQAVAATLGDVPRLPHWWTHDGTLHVELPKLPESISVRLPDQRDREVRSARTWQYTRGDADLAAENAKLRELVREVYVLHWHGLDCTECPWFDECDTDGGCPWMSIMHDHLCELGVEVDE